MALIFIYKTWLRCLLVSGGIPTFKIWSLHYTNHRYLVFKAGFINKFGSRSWNFHPRTCIWQNDVCKNVTVLSRGRLLKLVGMGNTGCSHRGIHFKHVRHCILMMSWWRCVIFWQEKKSREIAWNDKISSMDYIHAYKCVSRKVSIMWGFREQETSPSMFCKEHRGVSKTFTNS